ncbi:MAG TPA: site-2 protease family protein [Actinobacteria bacterium]|nr:site-2 protease family protein [Actinomycetota bacterium]
MIGSSVRLGSIWGVPIVLSGSWFLVAALITVTFAPSVESRVPGIGIGAYPVAFIFAVLLYASVFVHELGHVVVARLFGLPVGSITLSVFGGMSEIQQEPQTPWREFAVSAIGPIVSLLLGALGVVTLRTMALTGVVSVLVLQVTIANLFVGAFNLLPGLPLDGGRILRAAVWGIGRQRRRATVVAAWAGRVVAGLAVALPFITAALRGGEPDVVSVVWAAFIGALLWNAAGASLAALRREEVLPMITVDRFVRPCVVVPPRTPLAQALELLSRESAGGIVVSNARGEPVGVVSEAAVAAVPLQRRPWVDTESVMRTLTEQGRLVETLSGEELLQALQWGSDVEYLVLTTTGDIRGVISGRDIAAALSHKTGSLAR